MILLPNTKGNERLEQLTRTHAYMHPSKWHLLATNKNNKSLYKAREYVMGEKGVRFNLN